MDALETVGKLNDIIREQTDIIDDIFAQLMQYETIDDAEHEIEMIAEVGRLKKEIGEL